MGFWDVFKPQQPAVVQPKPYLFPLVPAFDAATVPLVNQYLNPLQHPTAATCDALMKIFGAASWSRYVGVQGESIGRPHFLWVKGSAILDGTAGASITVPADMEIDAYFLAFPFVRMPEEEYPDPAFGSYARRYAWASIAQTARTLGE